MIRLISRKEFFKAHPIADKFVASLQQSDYNTFHVEPASVPKYRKIFDRLDGVTLPVSELDAFCVMAYVASSRKDYVQNFPEAIIQLFHGLGADRYYLLHQNSFDWKNLLFESFQKRNLFKRIVRNNFFKGCFEVDARGLRQLLPLFFFSSRANAPSFVIYPATRQAPLAMTLCDEGNLHVSCMQSDKEAIAQCAAGAGLNIGDTYICWTYYWQSLSR